MITYLRSIGMITFIAVLSACGPLPQFDAAIQKQVNLEQQAYNRIDARGSSECGYTGEIPERSEIMDVYFCREKIVIEELLPVAFAQDLVTYSISRSRAVTEEYAQGNISKAELIKHYQDIEYDYIQKVEQRYYQARSRVLQQQQAYADNLRAAGQALQQPAYGNTYTQCSSLSIAPIAAPGCNYVCINGQWAEVCR